MQKHLRLLLLLTVFVSVTGVGQDKTRLLNGKVESFKNDVADILIINLNSRKSTITDAEGQFTIEVKVNDSLRFTAVQYHIKEIEISDSILRANSLTVNLVENTIDLDEVTVTPYNLSGKLNFDIDRLGLAPAVTSSTMGLPNAGLQKMTQSERLLIEADRGKYVYFGLGLAINTHKIMNKLSGRTKSFEEMVARDENMLLEREIITKFSKETLSENFDIPETNIDAFLSYCLSQPDFKELTNTWDTTEVWDYLKARSLEFKKMD